MYTAAHTSKKNAQTSKLVPQSGFEVQRRMFFGANTQKTNPEKPPQ
jgi:hypothetical protein